MKILIADDNIDDRSLLRCVLENNGVETVIEAGDGSEALRLTAEYLPDLIMSDALMPHMDGFQYLRAVKKDAALQAIPFVFYSAVYTGYREEELALSLGADAFIIKPKEPEELWQAVMEVLKNHPPKTVGAAEAGELRKEDEEFIRSYGDIVSTKLEEKIGELQAALRRSQAAEQALREQFATMNTIFDSISAIVFVADLECDRLLFLNRHGSQLFGSDWHGKTCAEFIPEEQHKAMKICYSDRPRQEPDEQLLTWEFRNAQSGRWYQCMERIIRWTDGRPVRLAVAFDITERKEIDRVKDEMISTVSHELRTPLTAILGFMELLDEEVSPDRQREYLTVIREETEKLDELIGNFLTLQRLQTRRITPGRFKPVDMRSLLEEVAFQHQALAPAHRIRVVAPSDLQLEADRREVREMLANLVSNAVKFSPGGGEVLLEARRGEHEVTVIVRDEGIGIPPDMLEKIFERFYQVDSSDRRRFRGSGLGLAVVRELAKDHGGKVWAESTGSNGSTFYLSLPLRHEEAAS